MSVETTRAIHTTKMIAALKRDDGTPLVSVAFAVSSDILPN
jgi:hypothetical protein